MREHKKRIGIIILTRFSSTRLPGKALLKIAGKPVLQYIVERVVQVVDKKDIVIATSSLASDDPIGQFAIENGLKCFRGSLENVAERFYTASLSENWDFATRINGDNIFVDTLLLKEMIHAASNNNYDFISNVKGRTYPKGMSIEIVKLNYYKSLLPAINNSGQYREHVTLYLYEHDEGADFFYFKNRKLPEAAGVQLALDTKEDFERSREIIEQFKSPHWTYNMKEILDIMKQNEYE